MRTSSMPLEHERVGWGLGFGFLAALVVTVAAMGVTRTSKPPTTRLAMDAAGRRGAMVAPPAVGLRFAVEPADDEFLRVGGFPEPLVPVGPTTAGENNDLARALTAYDEKRRTGDRDAVGSLAGFLNDHPSSPWVPVLLVNLGTIYRSTGHFSKALAAWQQAWRASKDLAGRNGEAVGDAAVAKLSQFEAYLGRQELLAPLLAEVRDRPLRGTAAEIVSESRRGLFEMQSMPGVSFKCGPLALKRILLHQDHHPAAASLLSLDEARSTPKGLSLSAVRAMSAQAGMNYQMAFRAPGAPVVLPAVAHWKVGHFAGLVGRQGGLISVEDPTFGEDIRIDPATLDEEASGYFLLPPGPLPEGWRAVSAAEGDGVWGRGNTGSNKDNGATGPGEAPALPSQGGCGGCTTWNVEAMVVGLSLHDAPVGYAPPVGPPVRFELFYSQRDTQQPQTFNYVNLGRKWTTNWLSYVTDQLATNLTAVLYRRGGGNETFTFATSDATSSQPGVFSQSQLTRLTDGSGMTTGYSRLLPDGSTEVFAQALGNQYFMTAVADPQGNKVSLAYDAQMRIAALTDAIGQATTLSYGLAADSLKVTKVTDPFGRSASFTYDDATSELLTSITDVLGIQSQFTYADQSDFVRSLETPYGTSTFVFGDGTTDSTLGSTRFLTATDTLGRTSRVEFNQNPQGSMTSDAIAPPQGMMTTNYYLEWRNTYVWNAQEYTLANTGAGLDYSKATLLHWLHTPDATSTSRILESTREPLENRVWYDYAGQSQSIFLGSSNQPLHVGRVLDDGTTELWSYQYNAFGKLTQATDPAGRTLTFTYDPNGIDLFQVANTTGAAPQVLATATYNTQHEPLSVTGANGATSTFTYNAAGQPLTFTDAVGSTTTFAYDASGYRTGATGPLQASYAFLYDHFGRMDSVTDPAGSTVQFTYDPADRVQTATFPDATTSKFAYRLLDLAGVTDRLGRATMLDHDSERQVVAVVDPLGHTTSLGYDLAGSLSSITDPNGHTTSLSRDGQERVVAKQYADGTSQTTAYEQTTSRVHATTDAKMQTATFAYNGDGTLASMTYAGAAVATPDVQFTYDPTYVRVNGMTDGIGQTSWTYGPVGAMGANEVQSVTSPVAGAPGATDTVSYTYDALGRAVSRTVAGAAESRTFDALGRLATATSPLDTFTYGYADATPRLTAISSAHGPQVSLAYFDPKGSDRLRQATFTGSGGAMLSQFGYTYDATGNVTTFTERYLGQKLAPAIGDGGSEHGWLPPFLRRPKGDLAGHGRAMPPNLAARTLVGLAAVLALVAFAVGRVGRSGRRTLGLLVPAALALLFAGCASGSGDHAGGTAEGGPPDSGSLDGASAATAQVTTYAYDVANRLVSALVGTDVSAPHQPQYAYAYDPASNLTSITAGGGPKTLAYTATNAVASGTYDPNGNPTTLDGATYTWDAADRVTSVVRGGVESDFTYDGAGRMARIVTKQGAGGSAVSDRAYTWCGTERCLERDNLQTGSQVSKRYFDQGFTAGGQGYYYAEDRLGSVRQIIDASGAVRAQLDYDPYGTVTKVAGDVDSDIGYAGYFYHAPSGLSLALHRAYDPANGRWLNRDPIGETGGLNTYGYVGGNPVGGRDPAGTCPWCIGAAVGAGLDLVGQLLGNGGDFGCVNWGQVVASGVSGALGGVLGDFATAAEGVNTVPLRLARVIPADFAGGSTLAAPGAAEAWVTAAEDLSGISTSEGLASRLALVDSEGNLIPGARAVIEFDTPAEGLASPIFRGNPGFVGRGFTAGGAREFVLPNIDISQLPNATIRIVP